MPQQRLNFFERRLEWCVLGGAALWVVTMVGNYGVQTPNRVVVDGVHLTPGELDAALRDSAERLQEHMRTLPAQATQVPRYHDQFERLISGQNADDAGTPNFINAALPAAAPYGAPLPELPNTEPARGVRLAPPLAPEIVGCTTGRSVFSTTTENSDAPTASTINVAFPQPAGALSWVCVGGVLDLNAQQEALRAAGYSRFRRQVYIVATELQRRERCSGGEYTAWKYVTPGPSLAPPRTVDPVFDPQTDELRNRDELTAAYHYVRRTQDRLCRPAPPAIDVGTPWQDPFAQCKTLSATELAVQAVDDTAQPGHTYQYRLRLVTWNRYVARPDLLVDPQDADHSTITGAWSQPTEPITVAQDVHFFVRGGRPDTQQAFVEVWKWRLGEWLSARFTVAVGDQIGGEKEVALARGSDGTPSHATVDFSTGAVVLDLTFCEKAPVRTPAFSRGPWTLRSSDSVGVTFADSGGDVGAKQSAFDRYDPLQKTLAQAQPKPPTPPPAQPTGQPPTVKPPGRITP